jgi:hypothetical protein
VIVQVLATLRFLTRPGHGARVVEAPARSRRKSARAAVWCGIAAFALLTAAMATAVDTVKPEWRDPEFALRLEQLRKWQALAPQRPLVVAFGSSRTQMGLSPAAMGFPDEPGSPLVYNFGYRAAHPLGSHLNFTRVRDAGVKPDAILIQLAAVEAASTAPADRGFPRSWLPRLTIADQRRLAPHTASPWAFPKAWASSRLTPWNTYREAILSDLLPDWQRPTQRIEFTWEAMDDRGFAPNPFAMVPDEVRSSRSRDIRTVHARTFASFAPGERTGVVFRGWVDRCRAEGTPVAFFWAPEALSCRALYSPVSLEAIATYSRQLSEEFGSPVFPLPTHLEEADFADGFHLLKPGAEKYSRWLAENHLKPWLAKVLRGQGGAP